MSYDIYVDTFYEFPPVTGLELHDRGGPFFFIRQSGRRVSPAHAQGMMTAFAYHRREARKTSVRGV